MFHYVLENIRHRISFQNDKTRRWTEISNYFKYLKDNLTQLIKSIVIESLYMVHLMLRESREYL